MDSCFMVNASQQLQSAATTADEAYLSVRAFEEGLSLPESLEWRFWIRENFSPSANNFAEVWLMADSAALRSSSAGYFLRFGSAGSQDAIELYRKDALGEQLICKGQDALIATSFKMAVKVNRDREGHWTVSIDPENVGNYVVDLVGDDNTYVVPGYFGFYIKHTSSNVKKFYFDEVYVGPTIIDMEPPELLEVSVDGSRLLLQFNESLDTMALAPSHYLLEPLHRHPDTVRFLERPSKIMLAFSAPLPENENLQLKVTDLADLSGNVLAEATWDFCLYVAAEYDVVINEIMADPAPVVGLPEWEYIELFNTTPFSIDLTGWVLSIGNSDKVLPSVRMDPQGYLILCKTEAEGALSAFGRTCALTSFSVANMGTVLRLWSPTETLVSEVAFDDTWYHDADKKEGGWSLEQIDPYNPCAGTFNWSASTDLSGGTPGRVNSINAPNAFNPKLERVSMLGDDGVLLWFDQQMDRASLSEAEHYQVLELNLTPVEVVCNPLEATSVRLQFDTRFQEGVIYTLLVSGVMNCSGNPIEEGAEAHFGIPYAIGEQEILINEILFDPIAPGVDYVELYNPTDKAFDLGELRLGVVKESFPNPSDTTLKAISEDSRLFLPQTYLLLSTDGVTLAQQYGCELGDHVDMKSFPSYPTSGGVALLMSRQGVVVDQMAFSPEMHYPLLKETKGVSLERVSWSVPSSQPDNWHSAAEAVRFGTPGYENSMKAREEAPVGQPLTIVPEVFSPDGDGFDDLCVVRYAFDSGEGTMNAYVFNADGQMVRHLVKGELVGKEGSFVWNGLDRRGNRVPLGVYVLVVEVFDLEGTVRRYRHAVAVASR